VVHIPFLFPRNFYAAMRGKNSQKHPQKTLFILKIKPLAPWNQSDYQYHPPFFPFVLVLSYPLCNISIPHFSKMSLYTFFFNDAEIKSSFCSNFSVVFSKNV